MANPHHRGKVAAEAKRVTSNPCACCAACEFGGALAAELAFACHVFAAGKAKGLYAHSNFSRSKV
jgi:hypothetical protein